MDDQLSELMDSVRLRTYAQKNPLTEYQLEGFDIFDEMLYSIRLSVLTRVLMVRLSPQGQVQNRASAAAGNVHHGSISQLGAKMPVQESRSGQTVVRSHPKIGRNDPCPCGSGKKYKNCCGRDA